MQTKSWLGLNLKNRYVLVADYLALFILSRVMLVDSKSIRSTSYWVNIIDSPVEYEDFLKPRFVPLPASTYGILRSYFSHYVDIGPIP